MATTSEAPTDGLSLFTVEEVARLFRVSEEAVRGAVRQGRLHAYRLGDGPKSRIRIPSSSVAKWLVATNADVVERR